MKITAGLGSVDDYIRYVKAGADELVFLDITASSDARETVVDMVEAEPERSAEL